LYDSYEPFTVMWSPLIVW